MNIVFVVVVVDAAVVVMLMLNLDLKKLITNFSI